MGVLIFEGMKVGVIDDDFTVCVDEHGKMDSKLILSTSYKWYIWGQIFILDFGFEIW